MPAGQQDIGGTEKAIQGALPGPIPVVEEVFRVGIVDSNDRVPEDPLLLHAPQTHDPGSGLLSPGDNPGEQIGPLAMEDRDRIGPVIHGDMGADLQGALNMLVIGPSILSPAGKHWNAQVFDQGGSNIVLRAQRVAGAQGHLRPARLERPKEIGRLGRYMETG